MQYIKCVRRFNQRKLKTQTKRPKAFKDTKKGIEMQNFGAEIQDSKKDKEKDKVTSPSEKLAKLGSRKKVPGGYRGKKKKKAQDTPKKEKKEARTWAYKEGKVDAKAREKFDFSTRREDTTDDDALYEDFNPEQAPDLDDSDSETETEEEVESATFTSGLWSRFQSLAGTKALTEDDLAPGIGSMREHLIGKNVAVNIAEDICQSVTQELVGQTCGTFTTIYRKVREATREALTRILTPARPRNILHEIGIARSENRPYSIVFVGVNGVGKSTSLAKIAHYFGQRNLKVSLCACDTFRAGAVEQLKTHSQALKVRLYDRGYGKEPSEVAARGIREAYQNKDDVVLIDTAGRMQGNTALMRELAKLIANNRPDLVLFVGEALVGNDGVDQLTKFNQALADHSNARNPRLIEGIVLTKFDTVDDKVGAAISMCHVSQKPILFVGVGQNYPDMKRLNVKTLLNKLFQ